MQINFQFQLLFRYQFLDIRIYAYYLFDLMEKFPLMNKFIKVLIATVLFVQNYFSLFSDTLSV